MALEHAILPVAPPIPRAQVFPTRTDSQGKKVTNTMLLCLPEEEFRILRPRLESVEMPQYHLLYDQSTRIEHAYFVNEGMVSLVILSSDGRSIEVGITGREGVVGIPPIFGLYDAPNRAIVQLPGNGARVPWIALAELFAGCPTLRQLMERYVFTQQLQIAQTAVCNRLHDMERRLARWLLMCQDTVDSGLLLLTHDFIAQMLGTGRPTVTITAGLLVRAGLIENSRGKIKILNRKRLEDAACECYAAIQGFRGALSLA